jgi:hypothetical protein
MKSYTAGQGYRDGWNDRIDGRPSRNTDATVAADFPYWKEYSEGYKDAESDVMEQARQSVLKHKRFLSEGS